MEHVHYDFPPIEAGIRKLFATAPPEAIHDDAQVVAAFRTAAPVEIEMTRCYFRQSLIDHRSYMVGFFMGWCSKTSPKSEI